MKTALTRTAYVSAVESRDEIGALRARYAAGAHASEADIMAAQRASGTFARLRVEGLASEVVFRVTAAEAKKLRLGSSAPLRIRLEMDSAPPAVVPWACACGNENLGPSEGPRFCKCGSEMHRKDAP